MAVFWNLVLATMVLMLWYYALRAALIADRREKLVKKLEGWVNPDKS